MINYKPFNERTPDSQYQDSLRLIRDIGKSAKSMHVEESVSTLARTTMNFDLSNGAPLITERDCSGFWKSAVNELLAFAIHGIRTQEELVAFGVSPRYWESFVTKEKCAIFGLEEGDLGDGSYGPGFVRTNKDGYQVHQTMSVIAQIRRYPDSRTHFIDPWIPEYTVAGPNNERKVVVAPCHGWMHFRFLDEKLNLHMYQRAGDVPIGVPSNMIQYAAFLIAISHYVGLEAGEYSHTISDAHFYTNQVEAVNEIVSRPPKQLPTLSPGPDFPDDIFELRAHHFTLSDYYPHEPIKGIPVAI